MPTNLYGPGDNYHPTNSHVFPGLIRRFHEAAERGDASVTCWGSGTPLREFLHVDDLSEDWVFALEHWQPGPDDQQFLNVGTGVDLTIRELAEAVAEATGFQGEIHCYASKADGTPKKQLNLIAFSNRKRIHRLGIALITTGAMRLMPARSKRSWTGLRSCAAMHAASFSGNGTP